MPSSLSHNYTLSGKFEMCYCITEVFTMHVLMFSSGGSLRLLTAASTLLSRAPTVTHTAWCAYWPATPSATPTPPHSASNTASPSHSSKVRDSLYEWQGTSLYEWQGTSLYEWQGSGRPAERVNICCVSCTSAAVLCLLSDIDVAILNSPFICPCSGILQMLMCFLCPPLSSSVS